MIVIPQENWGGHARFDAVVTPSGVGKAEEVHAGLDNPCDTCLFRRQQECNYVPCDEVIYPKTELLDDELKALHVKAVLTGRLYGVKNG